MDEAKAEIQSLKQFEEEVRADVAYLYRAIEITKREMDEARVKVSMKSPEFKFQEVQAITAENRLQEKKYELEKAWMRCLRLEMSRLSLKKS